MPPVTMGAPPPNLRRRRRVRRVRRAAASADRSWRCGRRAAFERRQLRGRAHRLQLAAADAGRQPAAASAATAAAESAESATAPPDAQHRPVLDQHRERVLVVAVEDRARLVAEQRLDHRARHVEAVRVFNRHARRHPVSTNVCVVWPSVISTPPSSTNFSSSRRPSRPRPPRRSSV